MGAAALGPRRPAAAGKAAKLDKKGQPKVGRLKKLGGQARMIKQAYSLTRKNDPKLPWIMLIAFVAVAARDRAGRHPVRLARSCSCRWP